MKLYSTHLVPLWLEAVGSGPQQVQGEPPDEKRVHSTRHDRFSELGSVPSFRFHHTTEVSAEHCRLWLYAVLFASWPP
jgi:hypothetical protein